MVVVVDQSATMSSPSDPATKTPPPLEDEKVPSMTNGETTSKDKDESSEDDEDKLIIHEERKDIKAVMLSETIKRSPKRSADEVSITEVASKKSKTEKQNLSSSELENNISFLKKDLEALEILIVQKEEEWNSLLRLTKHKEELYARLVRKRQILDIANGTPVIKREESKDKVLELEGERDPKHDSVVFLPEGSYASIGESPFMLLKHFLGSAAPQLTATTSKSKKTPNGPQVAPPPPYPNNISVIDIHTPKTPADVLYKDCVSNMKHILPKPPSNLPGYPAAPVTGFGPQGPTVSIQQLIAAHRKDNPMVPPMRGAKRGAWRHKYYLDKRIPYPDVDRPSGVSSSITCNSELDSKINLALRNNNNNSLPMSDPSVSYNDVLLQFAQLTKKEIRPGSPQISIIPVGDSHSVRRSEPIPDSTSVSREVSQANHLESSSALAKLLMESGGNSQASLSITPPNDVVPGNISTPQHLTLSALLSGGTTTTVKDKKNSGSQSGDGCPKKNNDDSTPPSTNPKCQGCHKNTAKFVCAGCGNQWYCSRNCQVAAWEDHSEHCTM